MSSSSALRGSVLVCALALALATSAQAIVFGPYGPGGTWNAYELVTTTKTWDTARRDAALTTYMGFVGHLATVGSAAENSFLQSITAGAERWIGLTDSTATSTLDGFNFAALGTVEYGNTGGQSYPPGGNRGLGWAWVTGEPVVYGNWANLEPNDSSGAEDACQIRTDGLWNDNQAGPSLGQGGAAYGYLIEYDTAVVGQPPVVASFDPISGHYYERYPASLSWDQARVNASTRVYAGVKGHLATIGGSYENGFVRNVGGQADKWIGHTDATVASTLDGFNPTTLGAAEFGNTGGQPYPPGGNRGAGWVWVTGEPVVYRNWNGGEPNDSGSEDAAHIRSDGLWNDNKAGASIGNGADYLLTSVVEFDPNLGLFNYLERRANTALFGTVDNLAEAAQLLGLPDGDARIAAQFAGMVGAINFYDPEQGNTQLGSVPRIPFLTNTGAADNDFAVRAWGMVYIPAAGNWTFAVAHDDNFRLTIGSTVFNSPGCCGAPTLATFNLAQPGLYNLDLLWFERAGGANLQLFAAYGNVAWNPSTFALVGDVGAGGLAMAPEPATLSLLGIGMAAALWRRRRRA